jgi:hypothetical protein
VTPVAQLANGRGTLRARLSWLRQPSHSFVMVAPTMTKESRRSQAQRDCLLDDQARRTMHFGSGAPPPGNSYAVITICRAPPEFGDAARRSAHARRRPGRQRRDRGPDPGPDLEHQDRGARLPGPSPDRQGHHSHDGPASTATATIAIAEPHLGTVPPDRPSGRPRARTAVLPVRPDPAAGRLNRSRTGTSRSPIEAQGRGGAGLGRRAGRWRGLASFCVPGLCGPFEQPARRAAVSDLVRHAPCAPLPGSSDSVHKCCEQNPVIMELRAVQAVSRPGGG